MTIYSLSIYHWMFYKGVFRNVPHSCAVVTLFGGEWLLWILMVFHCESMVSWPYNNYEWPYFWNETSSKPIVTIHLQKVWPLHVNLGHFLRPPIANSIDKHDNDYMINWPYFSIETIIKINSNHSPPKSVTTAYEFATFRKTPYSTHHWCI